MKKRIRGILAFCITLAMIFGLVQVPMKNVEAGGSTVKKIDLTIDTAGINLNTDYTEGEVSDRLSDGNYISVKSDGLDLDNSGLSYKMKTGLLDTDISNKYNVKLDREYYYCITMYFKKNWAFSDEIIKMIDENVTISFSDVSGHTDNNKNIQITVNGKTQTDGYIEGYIEDGKLEYFNIYIKATPVKGSKDITEPAVKTVNEIKINYDPDYVNFFSGEKFEEISARFGDSSGTLSQDYYVYTTWISTKYVSEENYYEFWGVEETEKPDKNKTYYADFLMNLSHHDYFKWVDEVKSDPGDFHPLSSISTLKVYVNGLLAGDDAYYLYNEEADVLEIVVPYSSEAPANKDELVNMKDVTISGIKDMKYTGESVIPDYELTYGSTTLEESLDYIVTTDNDVDEGIATITFIGMGKYYGSVTRNYKIGKDIPDDADKDDADKKKPSYSKEWVDGLWYNADGTQTYKGKLSWKQNSTGWWVEDSSGWYPVSCWQKIDGKWYYFVETGYMDYSEYRDGCWLGADGAWNEDYSNGKWCSDSTGWWYEDNGWYPAGQYLWINGVNYYFMSNGYWDGK